MMCKIIGPNGEILWEGLGEITVEQKMDPPEMMFKGGPILSTIHSMTITVRAPEPYDYQAYNKKMKAKAQELEPVTEERLADLVEATAERLFSDGWIKNHYHSKKKVKL